MVQIDAHGDLIFEYEGSVHSQAFVMHRVLGKLIGYYSSNNGQLEAVG